MLHSHPTLFKRVVLWEKVYNINQMKPLQLIMIVTLCSLMCTGLDTEIVVKRHKHKKESLTRVSHFPYDLIPKGCYGQKQMRELFFGARRENLYKHKPITPDWCTETDYVIPKHLKVRKSETTAPPYHLHVNRFQQSKNIFQGKIQMNIDSIESVGMRSPNHSILYFWELYRFASWKWKPTH